MRRASRCSFSGELYDYNPRRSRYSVVSESDITLFKQQRELNNITEHHPDKDKDLDKKLVDSRHWLNSSFHSMRWIVIVLCGLNLSLMLFVRLGITVAIIVMVNQTETHTYKVFNNQTGDYVIETVKRLTFDWDNTIQFFIISVYMVTYGIFQVPFSILVERKGGYKVGAIAQGLSLLAIAPMPSFAYIGWEFLAGLRLLLGLAHCPIMSIGVRIMEKWIPASEITIAVTIIQFLGCTGIVLNSICTGYLTAIHWSLSFYVPCIVVAIWLILWLVIVRDNPEDCWLISQKELKLILNLRNYQKETIIDDDDLDGCTYTTTNITIKNPWRKIWKLPSLYAFLLIWSLVSSTGSCFTFILPKFLNQTQSHIDIANNGTIVFIIQSAGLLSYLWGIRMLTYLSYKDYSKTKARQIVYLISVIISVISWILPALIDGDPSWMLILNKLAHPVSEIIFIGTILDNFSNLGLSTSVFGTINTAGNFSNFPTSMMIGLILDRYGANLICWHAILFGFAAANLVALICFSAFIDSEPVEL